MTVPTQAQQGPEPTQFPQPATPGVVPRDRLQTFRWLFLVFALFTLAGVAIGVDFQKLAIMADRAEIGICAIILAAWWIVGYRREHFPEIGLLAEMALLVGFTMQIAEPLPALAVNVIGVQFRALYGTRRHAWFLAFAYGFAFVIGAALSPSGLSMVTPAVLVEVMGLGFCAYLLHMLKEVLERDQERTLALRQSEDQYRTLFHNNPWPMLVADPHTLRILDVNDLAVQQYGYSRDEFLRMSIRELRAPEERAAFERLRPTIEGQARFTHLTRHQKRDGSIIDVEVTSDVVEFGGSHARIALALDVTNRLRMERELRESEQRFRSVAENLREALMITDTDDRIIMANSRVRDVLGYEPTEVLGKNATELLLPTSQRNIFRDKLSKRLDGEAELYEAELMRKDGTRIFAEVSASPYRDATGRVIGTLGAISDVSERRRLEERLRQAMRMEAVGQLAGGVAHDFNNLLTVIKCHTELLLSDLQKSHPAYDGITEMSRAATRGATLTQQLLAFSRQTLLQPRRLTLAQVVSESAPMLRRMVGTNVELITRTDEFAGEVHADPMQLEYALVAMVRNSIDAMPRGGKITIETRALDISDAAEHNGTTQEMPIGRYAVMSVTDNGVGMEPAVVARAFEPFFTTKGPGEGSGLGLASVYGIVRQSGGFLDVESTPNVGTTFRIFLPLNAGDAGASNGNAGLAARLIAAAPTA